MQHNKLFWCFGIKCCHHLQVDWIWFRWMLKLMGERNVPITHSKIINIFFSSQSLQHSSEPNLFRKCFSCIGRLAKSLQPFYIIEKFLLSNHFSINVNQIHTEDRGNPFLRNVGIKWSHYMVWEPGIPLSEQHLPCKPEELYLNNLFPLLPCLILSSHLFCHLLYCVFRILSNHDLKIFLIPSWMLHVPHVSVLLM
jgi:hypothetical protein